MKITKETARISRRLFGMCFVENRLDESLLRLVLRKLEEGKPRGHLAILHSLARLVRIEQNRRSVVVESAGELSPPEREKISRSIDSRHGFGMTYIFVVKPELIAGLRIRVGDDVLDSTVSAKLNAFAESL